MIPWTAERMWHGNGRQNLEIHTTAIRHSPELALSSGSFASRSALLPVNARSFPFQTALWLVKQVPFTTSTSVLLKPDPGCLHAMRDLLTAPQNMGTVLPASSKLPQTFALYDLIDNTDRLPATADLLAAHLAPYEHTDLTSWLDVLHYAEKRLDIVEREVVLLLSRLRQLARVTELNLSMDDVAEQSDWTKTALDSTNKYFEPGKKYLDILGSGRAMRTVLRPEVGETAQAEQWRLIKRTVMQDLSKILAVLVRKKEVVRPMCEAALSEWCRIARTKGVYD